MLSKGSNFNTKSLDGGNPSSYCIIGKSSKASDFIIDQAESVVECSTLLSQSFFAGLSRFLQYPLHKEGKECNCQGRRISIVFCSVS